MDTQNKTTRTVIVFAALAITGVAVAVSAKFVLDAIEQITMVAIGSAVFGAGLTFFLVGFFTLAEK